MTITIDPQPSAPGAAAPEPDRQVTTVLGSGWLASRQAAISVALAVVLFCLVNAIAGSTGFWSADEAVTHRQVELLNEGIWTLPADEPLVDPESRFHTMNGVSVGENGRVAPYAKHPLFPSIVAIGDLAGGRFGRFAIPALGSILAAAAIAVGADRRRQGSGTLTFWMMLAGSPLLFHGSVLWAHSLSVFGAAVASLALQAHLERDTTDTRSTPRWPWMVAGVAAIVISVLLRSEAALFFVLAGVVLGVAGLLARRLSTTVTGAATVITTLATYMADGAWRLSILGPSPSVDLTVPAVALFDLEVRSVLVIMWTIGLEPGFAVLRRIGAVMLLLAAAGHGRHRLLGRPEFAYAGGALYLAATLAHSTVAIAVAAPALFVGLVFVRQADPFIRIAAATVVLFFGAVLMTSYANGGGGDWGGRYHVMSLAPLGMIAGAALWDALQDDRRPVVIASAVASLALMIGMVADLEGRRSASTDLAVELEERLAVVAEPDDLLIITDGRVGRLLGDWGVDRRMLQVRGEDVGEVVQRIPGEEIVLINRLSSYEAPDDWILLAEDDDVRRYRIPG